MASTRNRFDRRSTTTGGRNGGLPPHWGDDGDNTGSHFFETRLRRARLGLFVGFVRNRNDFYFVHSAYVVRQGLPTLDPSTNVLLPRLVSGALPKLMLINTVVLLVSTFTMELARRKATRNAALCPARGVPGYRWTLARKFRGLALTIVLGLSFLAGQWMVWRELAANGFYLSSSPSSSFVYLLTGMHGVHLFGGVVALLTRGRRVSPAPACRFTIHCAGRNRLVLALHGFLWVFILCLLEFVH